MHHRQIVLQTEVLGEAEGEGLHGDAASGEDDDQTPVIGQRCEPPPRNSRTLRLVHCRGRWGCFPWASVVLPSPLTMCPKALCRPVELLCCPEGSPSPSASLRTCGETRSAELSPLHHPSSRIRDPASAKSAKLLF